MIIASSISGLPIYAPSAAFAPTNSAEVSAIASAYQVVSSTATQLYAGTAYVTSVNDAPLSASRAGNAANASLASSAWYDGTGRLISALPDEATVSAIASSYAESAASGKLDASESSNYYPTSNPSGFISSVDLSDYATTAYVDSSISGFAYNSAVSGWTAKQDALTFGYDTADKISGINGSALAGEGGGMVTAIGTSTSGITSINNSGLVDTAALHSADYSSLYVQEPLYISASGDSSYIGISGNVGGVDSATCSAIASAYAESAASSKLDNTASSSFYPADNPSGFISSVDLSDYATTAYVDSSVSSKLDSTASSQFLTAVPAGYATTAYVDSSISAFAYESAVSGWTAKQDTLTFGYDGPSISSIDGSALAGGTQVVTSLQYKAIPIIATATASGGPLGGNQVSAFVLSLYPDTAIGAPLYTELSSITSFDLQLSGYYELTAYFGQYSADTVAVMVKPSALDKYQWSIEPSDYQLLGTLRDASAGLLSGDTYTASIQIRTNGFSSNTWADGQTFDDQHPYIAIQHPSDIFRPFAITYASGTAGYYGGNGGTAISGVNEYPLYAQMSYQTQPSYQTAYASASATQATAQDVLYILLPDGV